MYKLFPKLFILIIIISFFSCKEDSVLPPIDMGYDYFPYTSGQWISYNVDSIYYDDFTGTVDTFNFQIKEYIESTFMDNEGRPTERIEKYYRPNDTTSWVLANVLYSTLTDSRAEKVVENIKYIKLAFPANIDKTWDGNAFNTLDEEIYSYEDVDIPYSINGMNFDFSLTVIQEDFVSLISEDYAIEVYAKEVGMIYKEVTHIIKDPATGKIRSGVDYKYSIISYGK